MLTISYRVAALFAAGAVLVGWLSASLVVPPAVISQERPRARRAVTPSPPIPSIALAAVRPSRVTPGTARNPFAFAGRAAETAATRRDTTPAVETAPTGDAVDAASALTAAPAAPAVPWRLAGVASDDAQGFTAILTGDGDVHLVRAGDALGTTTIEDVSAAGVTLRLASGETLTLRLP